MDSFSHCRVNRLRVFIIWVLIAIACAVWSPWNYINFYPLQLLGVEPLPEIGGLVVNSLAGEISVSVDGTPVGKAIENNPLSLPDIEPGERLVTLERNSEIPGAYWEYSQLIKFESGVDAVLSYELGPTEAFSAGHLIYAVRDPNRSANTFLNLTASPDGATVEIDGASIGTVPIIAYSLKLDNQVTVRVSKEGYETQEFKLFPEAQADRLKLQGFDLNVDVNLFLQPIVVR
jgi:hypothetical protein